MSRTLLAADDGAKQRSRRPFDAVVITLSAALLVIFGIVIGRFVVTNRAVDVVDHFDAEMAALRAEIVELHRQNLQSQARAEELEASVARFRTMAQQHQDRAESLAARQTTVRTDLTDLAGRRERCLDQVRQYVALNQPIPAMDVLHFAQAMFQLQDHAIGQLSGIQTTSATIPTVPGFPPVAAATPAPTTELASSQPTPSSDLPTLPAPGGKSPTASGSAGAIYFATPRRAPAAGNSTFFAPRRSNQQHSPGITFHDTAGVDDGTARR